MRSSSRSFIHELATNAAKYGSLSQPEGHLHVRGISIAREKHPCSASRGLSVAGRRLQRPVKDGFGSQLISAILPDAQRSFESEGVEFIAHVPLADLLQVTPTGDKPATGFVRRAPCEQRQQP